MQQCNIIFHYYKFHKIYHKKISLQIVTFLILKMFYCLRVLLTLLSIVYLNNRGVEVL